MKIDVEAVEEFLKVRDTGLCNMFDRLCVRQVAEMMGLENLLEYCETTPKYVKLIEMVNQYLLQSKKESGAK